MSTTPMTPREQWDAAVALQYRAVADLAALPFDDAGSRRFVELVNQATQELQAALGRVTVPPCIGMDEWNAAYQLHRDAIFRRLRQTMVHRAQLQAEDRRAAGVAMWERVKPWL